MTILYALIEQRPGHANFGRPLYIGIGTLKRPYTHISRARRGVVSANILLHAAMADHFSEGVEPAVQIIGHFDDRESAATAEIEHIARYGRFGRDAGGILCNVAVGGNGPDPSLMQDPEVLARIAAASKANWDDPNFRKIRDAALKAAYKRPETIAKVSEETMRALREPETRAKHLTALKRINAAMTTEQRKNAAAKVQGNRRRRNAKRGAAAANANPENQKIRSAASKAMNASTWADPEIRARRIAAMKGKKKTRSRDSDVARRFNAKKGCTLEANAKKAAASKARWADPAFKAKMAEKRRASWQDPETRARMLAGRSEGIAKSWEDPAVRARRIDGIKAASVDPVEREDGHGEP